MDCKEWNYCNRNQTTLNDVLKIIMNEIEKEYTVQDIFLSKWYSLSEFCIIMLILYLLHAI